MKYVCLIALALAMLLPVTVSAQATTTTTNEQVPFNMTLNNACLGEPVVLSGTLHVLNHVTVTPAGDVYLKTHAQPQGVTGTGQVSGMKWQATGVTQQEVHTRTALPFTRTFVNNFKIVGEGKAPNYMVHNLIHVTVNPNGVTTSDVSNTSVECR